jgi:type II secretory pathway component GspD/PulD (secretin)
VSFAAAICALAAPVFGTQASDLFRKGQKFEKAGNYTQAYLLYTEAATLEPANARYQSKAAALQVRAAKNAKIDLPSSSATLDPDPAPSEPKPEDFSSITAFELSKARQAQPPAQLKLPSGRFDMHLSGEPKAIFDQVAQRCGLQTSFDGDYTQAPQRVRFDVTDATCAEILRETEAATGSFIVPLSSKLIFISKDTPAKRIDNEQTMSAVIPVPTAMTTQEITEIAQAVRQTTGIEKIAWSAATDEIVIRDRVSRVIPAKAIIEQLAAHRGQVMVDVRFLSLTKSQMMTFGINLTNSISIFYAGNSPNATGVIPAASTASQTVTTAIKLFGGGATVWAMTAVNASVVANLTDNNARTILETQLRAVSGLPSTLHVGDKYPVLTSGYFGTGASAGQPGVYTPTPSFTYQDLGVSLKITPIVSNDQSITMDVESEYQLLAGTSANGIPLLASRKVASRISVKNDEWAVVAGLIDQTKSKTINGFAGLGHVPLLGQLFRTTTREDDRDRILIVLKPHIVGLAPGSRPTPEVRVGSENRPLSPL